MFVNIGKSVAAYERALRVAPNALDRYAGGETGALSDLEKDGLRAFFETGCAQCHWGGRLTDDAFHPLRFPSGHQDFTPDDGRIAGVFIYGASLFRADGVYSDAKQPRRAPPRAERDRGSFKTPALRGVAVTAPYGHGGSVPSLAMAVELHRTLGRPAGDRFSSGTVEPWLVAFDAARGPALLAFLQTLGFDF